MSEPMTDSSIIIDEDGIRVEKSYTDDEFPVPAIAYTLSSSREEATRVRVVDTIPESFPMDRVGFHPDFESDNWTAYKDHRVEFERVIDPGESVRTVFGIRDEEPDVEGFLSAPVIEHAPVGQEIEDVLGAGDSDAVREVLAGDRETLPGMEASNSSEAPAAAESKPDPSHPNSETAFANAGDATTDPSIDEIADVEDGSGLDTEANASTAEIDHLPPRETTAETTPAVTSHEPDVADELESDAGEKDTSDENTDSDRSVAIQEKSVVDDNLDANDRPDVNDRPDTNVSIAAALANELRNETVDEADIEVLRDELDLNVPRSVDVRLNRLQSTVADIEAYADALAEFIDEEGTAQELLAGLRTDVETVESSLSTIENDVHTAETERDEITGEVDSLRTSVGDLTDTVSSVDATVERVENDLSAVKADVQGVQTDVESAESAINGVSDDVTTVEQAVEDVDDDIETLYEEVDATGSAITETDSRVDDVESRLDRFEAEFDDVWSDVAEVDARLSEVEGALGEDVDDIESELQGIHDHLAELEAFRKRLNEAFGP